MVVRTSPGTAANGGPDTREEVLDRTVVVAYSANPEAAASVPLIGYRITKGIHDLTSTTVIAHRRDAHALRKVFPPERIKVAGSARFAAALRAVTTRLFAGKWGLISMLDFPDYLLFDLHAYLIGRRMLRRRRVDYVLRVNPISFRFPSLLGRLRAPVFTGPHNGGMDWPPGFRHLDAREGTGQRFRFVGDLLHRLYGDSRRYAGIFVAHDQCAAAVPEADRTKVTLICENGVDQLGEPGPNAGDARRLLYVGRLIPPKAVDVLIRAVARLPEDVRLTIVGDGGERRALERLATQLGVAGRITFEGHRPHDDVWRYYQQAGVFAFPSVRESGGGAVLEAMSYGLPCLVAAWGGPMLYTEETGVHLRVDSPQTLEDDLVAAVRRLLDSPDEARRIGQHSREVIAERYLWSGKVAHLHRHAMAVVAGAMPRRRTKG